MAPDVADELVSLLSASDRVLLHEWDERSLGGFAAVVAATPSRPVNEAISLRARETFTPVNVVDDPDLCTFIIPAIIDRNPLIISVSSSGSSPVLARRIRSDIEARYPTRYAELSRYLGERRTQVAGYLTTERERRHFWEQLLDSSEFIDLVLASNREAADALFEKVLSEGKSPRGAVYLIGAGPGDPELLTFKALRLLQQADIVLYDRLIGEGILELARRDADKIYVGKQRAEHAMPQSEINATLLSLAKSGKRVARLKGGDPFIFGRGGEEIEGLLAAGVEFEVVPGVTAASGAACYAGIPLTHRDHAQSVRFITGHTKDHQLDLPWQQFMNEQETLVFYMGLAGLAIITRELIRAGRSPDTPIAIIEKATRVDQRVISGTLASIQQVAEMEKPEAPTLLIIGGVVTLHSSLRWYSPQ
jgi:uroporphyrin-III C-methyltransferase/precorrin-2 dehydrogenase/sirohydrochlorin ferrochelatase